MAIRVLSWRLVLVIVLAASAAVLTSTGQAARLEIAASASASVSSAGAERLLVKFDDLSSLSDKEILYAKCVVELALDSCTGKVDLLAAPLTRDWDPESVSWLYPWDSIGGDFSLICSVWREAEGSQAAAVEFLVTSLVEHWVDGLIPNNGIILIPLPRDTVGCVPVFASPGGTTSTWLRARLIVKYALTMR